MKAILILILFILFLINPIVGLVGLTVVLFTILAWVMLNVLANHKGKETDDESRDLSKKKPRD